MNQPIPYEPAFETPEDDEAQTAFDLQTTMRSIATKTYEDSGRALTALADSPVDLKGRPDGLRDAVVGRSARSCGCARLCMRCRSASGPNATASRSPSRATWTA